MGTPNPVAREEKILSAALESENYRTFIRNVAAAQSKTARPNMAALSRKAGFSSRGFISDVIEGRRRLSPSSYPRLIRALGLNPRLRSYFHLLVIRDEPDLNLEQLDPLCLEIRLKEVRSRLASDLDNVRNRDQSSKAILKARDVIDCYAALGTGATLSEVSRRTGLGETYVTHILEHLIQDSAAKKNGDVYAVDKPVISFDGLGADQNAKNCFLQSVGELKRKADSGFHSPDRGFSQFVFTVDPKRMPELKKQLWSLLQEFMENSEVADGDRVAKLVTGFYI